MDIKKPLPIEDLDKITLRHGSHPYRDHGTCAMEAVAWLAGEEHTDHPKCADSSISSFVIGWNDTLGGENAQRNCWIRPLLPLLLNTNVQKAPNVPASEKMRWIDYVRRELGGKYYADCGLSGIQYNMNALDNPKRGELVRRVCLEAHELIRKYSPVQVEAPPTEEDIAEMEEILSQLNASKSSNQFNGQSNDEWQDVPLEEVFPTMGESAHHDVEVIAEIPAKLENE